MVQGPIDPKKLAKDILAKQGSAEAARDRQKLFGLSLAAFWRYWLEMGANPYQHNWNLGRLRKDGKLEQRESGQRLKTSVNLINEELQDMVAKETSTMVQPTVISKAPQGLIQATWEPASGTDDFGEPIYKTYSTDEICDKAKQVIDRVLEEAGFENAWEERSRGRRYFGSMYLTLEWDPSAGETIPIMMRRDGEKWGIVRGQYEVEGDA